VKKLTKDQMQRKRDLMNRARELEERREQVEDRIRVAQDIVEETLVFTADYNSLREDIQDLANEVVEGIEGYIGDRSEKWQESDRASAYESWKDEWQEATNLEQVELILGDEIELSVDGDRMDELLERLPDEVEA